MDSLPDANHEDHLLELNLSSSTEWLLREGLSTFYTGCPFSAVSTVTSWHCTICCCYKKTFYTGCPFSAVPTVTSWNCTICCCYKKNNHT